jgi:hypothetical protein
VSQPVPLLRVLVYHVPGDDEAISCDVMIGEPPGPLHHESADDISFVLRTLADKIAPQITDIWARVLAGRN